MEPKFDFSATQMPAVDWLILGHDTFFFFLNVCDSEPIGMSLPLPDNKAQQLQLQRPE